MKLIFANNFFYLRGGSERVFFDEMEILRMNRHDVVPFSRKFEKNDPTEYVRYFAPRLEYENVSPIKKITSGIKLIYSRECKRMFNELMSCFRPDLIHAHNIYGRLTTSVLDAAKAQKIPVVMTLHDYKLLCPSYLMLSNGKVCDRCQGRKFFYCVVLKCHKSSLGASLIYTAESFFNYWLKKYAPVKFFISPSKFLLNQLAASGMAAERLVHIPNFINYEKFSPASTAGKYVLFAGRLSKEKGVLTLLRAVHGLDFPVKIVGEGPMRADYETYTREHGITNVTFEGYKSGKELENLFQNAAFLVFPSEWYENAPMTILEAFAHGKPVIGSDIGGIPEMVIDQKTGLLFEPANRNALRERIEILLSMPSLISEMGRAARKRVEQEYNAEMHYKNLMKVYARASGAKV